MLDLSTIYGVNDDALSKIRKGEHGMLILEKRQQRYVPQTINNIRLNRTNTKKVKNDTAKKVDDGMPVKTKEGKLMETKEDKLKETITETVPEAENLIELINPNTEIIANITEGLGSKDVCLQNRDNETTCYQFG